MDKSAQVIVEKTRFTAMDLEWVRLIRSAKEAGVSAEEVRSFLRMKRQAEKIRINIR
ncbi:anti-repressor SinI family protein [Paenibacillus sp. J22TS3]|uniref:anti-repressor SinI family protein n=1 Tax=Paenibacillus sp. J22TS3 TaxID=2807192 RepID=UPI001B2E236C|nr:anti-repressor SinI family protein [Paenibacillus sp. J22TS3]GIP24050.1 hypothetical protein J22TS3_43250 [Paenibacillus sp. J22TS3]